MLDLASVLPLDGGTVSLDDAPWYVLVWNIARILTPACVHMTLALCPVNLRSTLRPSGMVRGACPLTDRA